MRAAALMEALGSDYRHTIVSCSGRTETAEVIRNYQVAIACWNELATKYAGLEDAEEAPERLKKLKDSEEVKKDLEARHALLALMMSLDVEYQKTDDSDAAQILAFRKKCLADYRKFYADNKDNSAGDRAEELIENFEKLIPADERSEDPKKEEPPKKEPGTDGK